MDAIAFSRLSALPVESARKSNSVYLVRDSGDADYVEVYITGSDRTELRRLPRRVDFATAAFTGSYDDLTDVPSTFPPESHTHTLSEVTDSGGAAALNVGTTAGTVAAGDDSRLSDSREWTASTVGQVEAEAGTATTRRAWTAQRVFQAIAAWWAASSAKSKLDGIEAGAEVNDVTSVAGKTGVVVLTKSDVGLGNVANVDQTDASNLASGTLSGERFNDTSHGDRGGGSLHPAATTAVAGFMSASDKSKLDGVAANATANASDADLRDRSTHTGTQAIATITGLQSALDDKAALASPSFTGNPTAPTPTAGDNDTSIATTAFVTTAIDNLIGGAPAALDTLNELAAAIADDADYAATITSQLTTKANISDVYTREEFSNLTGIIVTGNAPDLSDLDATDTPSGWYRYRSAATSNLASLPSGHDATDVGLVEVIRYDSNRLAQRIIEVTGRDRVWIRQTDGAGTWLDWREYVGVYDTGSNSNGNWIRYTDGRMACWHDDTAVACTTSVGNVWANSANVSWTFPQSFATDDIDLAGYGRHSLRSVGFFDPSTTSVTYRVTSFFNDSTSRQPRLTAWGRWF